MKKIIYLSAALLTLLNTNLTANIMDRATCTVKLVEQAQADYATNQNSKHVKEVARCMINASQAKSMNAYKNFGQALIKATKDDRKFKARLEAEEKKLRK